MFGSKGSVELITSIEMHLLFITPARPMPQPFQACIFFCSENEMSGVSKYLGNRFSIMANPFSERFNLLIFLDLRYMQ
jgi:hypothetical protein